MGYGEIFKNLGRRYAERFVKEHPIQDIHERKPYILETDHIKIVAFSLQEIFGPQEAWPAAREDLHNTVFSKHSENQMSYQRLQEILLLERPSVLTRSYENPEEYKKVVAMNFGTILEGAYTGKLERIIKRKMDEVRRSSFIKRFYRKEYLAAEAIQKDNMLGRLEFYYSDKQTE